MEKSNKLVYLLEVLKEVREQALFTPEKDSATAVVAAQEAVIAEYELTMKEVA